MLIFTPTFQSTSAAVRIFSKLAQYAALSPNTGEGSM
jgi:hypothetical protein